MTSATPSQADPSQQGSTNTADQQRRLDQGSGDAMSSQTRSPRSLAQRSELVSDMGKTSIADSVVGKIAGISCREVSGVHDMGAGA